MKNYIYKRSSLDWPRIKSIQDYLDANRNARPLMKSWLPTLAKAIKEWDATFNIKYFEFRQRMKEITTKNLSQIKNAKTIDKYDKEKLKNEKDDFVVYPIDDDDWVSENMFDSVRSELGGDEDAAVWPFGFFRGDSVMVTDIAKPIDSIRWMYSNNAILTRKGYEKFCGLCTDCDFLEDHREADEYSRIDGVSVKVIGKALSAYNHSPASATKLWGLSAGKAQKMSVASLISDYDQLPVIPYDLEWALPCAKEMWELISMTKKRKVYL